MIKSDISDEDLREVIWGAAGAHAKTVHGGGVDRHCDACTQLCAAIDDFEATIHAHEDNDASAS